jgi:S-DNA-T family DNA segregation ATPase FtsK/SpoIIIE
VAAQLYDFASRQKLDQPTVVEGEVVDTAVLPPNLPVHVPRPARSRLPGRSLSIRVHPKLATAARMTAYHSVKFTLLDFPMATLRGLFLSLLAWWQWVYQSERRRETKLDGRYAAQAKDIAERSTARFKQTTISLGVGLLLFLMFRHTLTTDRLYVLIAGLVFLLFCRGYQWRAVRRPVGGKASVVWGGAFEAVAAALRSAGLMKDDQDLRPIEIPTKEGRGTRGVVLLPMGLSVAKVIKGKAAFASGLGCDSDFLVIWKDKADDRMGFWIPSGDPFKANTRRLPLLDVSHWNVWQPAPFGFTARDQDVDLSLVYSNMLIGAKPGAGKSFAARCAVAPFVLDPSVPIYVANGKPDGAWLPMKDLATRYICGRSDEMAVQVDDMLDEVQQVMEARFIEHLGTSSKIVESSPVSPMLVVVDELQNYTTNGLPARDLRGHKATLGDWIDFRLVDIAKNGRAAGVILVLVTQRPSDESLSTELRAQLGTRFALRCMDYHTSNMILGNVSKLGVDASTIQSQHRGLGILALDMEEGLVDEAIGDYPRVRSYLVEDEDWATLCARGYTLRVEAGTVPRVPDVFEDEGDIAPTMEDVMPEVPELLESVFDFAHELGDDERVPTTEIRKRFEPELSEKRIGGLFRSWGAPTGRARGGEKMGPRVGDIRAAVQRIRDGGPVNIAEVVQ